MVRNSLLALLILLGSNAYCSDLSQWHLMELDKVYVDYIHLLDATDPFMQPNYTPTSMLNLNVNLKMLNDVVFLDNMVRSSTDQYQYRTVGWNYKLGLHVGDSIDLYFEHLSMHILDGSPQYPYRYDGVGIRIYLYK